MSEWFEDMSGDNQKSRVQSAGTTQLLAPRRGGFEPFSLALEREKQNYQNCIEFNLFFSSKSLNTRNHSTLEEYHLNN